MKALPAERVPWYRPSSADAVFLFIVVLAFRSGARSTMLDDPGLGWHLRNIDAMRAEGGWLTRDPFTYPHDGQAKEWRTNQWLGELPLWLGWQAAGEEGIAAVVSLVLAFLLRCLYRVLLRDGIPWPLAVVWTALAALGTQCSWVARPNVFTMLYFLWTARVCELFHEGRCSARFTFWLAPLFALWANTHGGFLAGLVVLGASLGVEALLAIFAVAAGERRSARARMGHFALLLVACGTATLANPYGWSLYPWVLKLVGDPYFMNLNREWWTPDFHAAGSFRFEALMLLYPAVLALSRRRPNALELALGVLWLHFALTGFRYVPLWVLAAVPSMARSSVQVPWLEHHVARLGLTGPNATLFTPRTGPAGWGVSLLVAGLFVAGAWALQGTFARHNPTFIPTNALNRLLELHRERPQARIFHAHDWGGYLTWHGWPSFLNWIDDRNEVQGQGWIEAWNSIVTAEPGWERKLDAGRVEIIALQPDSRLIELLSRSEEGTEPMRARAWQEIYRDDFAVIFRRPPLGTN